MEVEKIFFYRCAKIKRCAKLWGEKTEAVKIKRLQN